MEELVADVVGQLVRLPFDWIGIRSDLLIVEFKCCLVLGHLLLVEFEVWGEEG